MKLDDLDAAIEELRLALPADIDPADLAMWADIRDAIGARAATLKGFTEWLGQALFEAVPQGATVESEGRTFKRTGKPSRKQWDTSLLLHAVFDSRRADANGEVVDETPVDKVLDVWNLGAPRLTALAARQIDPDEFSTVEWSGRDVKEVVG